MLAASSRLDGTGSPRRLSTPLLCASLTAALRLVAAKKGVSEQEVGDAVAAAAPSSSGTRADSDAVLAHFTDTSQYTGAHKHRFDEAGKGKGPAGRDSIAKGNGHKPSQGLAGLADRSPADVRGVKY